MILKMQTTEFPTIFFITEEEINLNDLLAKITLPTTGAAAIFTGMVRGVTSRDDPQCGLSTRDGLS